MLDAAVDWEKCLVLLDLWLEFDWICERDLLVAGTTKVRHRNSFKNEAYHLHLTYTRP